MLRALSNDRDEVRALSPEIGRDMLDAVLDALADAVLLVDGPGRVVRANAAAERLLAGADGLARGIGGRLRAASPAGSRALERLLAMAASGRPGGALSLGRPSGGPPLRLLAVPLPRGAAPPGLRPRPTPSWSRSTRASGAPCRPSACAPCSGSPPRRPRSRPGWPRARACRLWPSGSASRGRPRAPTLIGCWPRPAHSAKPSWPACWSGSLRSTRLDQPEISSPHPPFA